MKPIALAEAAKKAGLGQNTLYRWLREGKLQRYRQPGDVKTYLDWDELQKHMTMGPAQPRAVPAASKPATKQKR